MLKDLMKAEAAEYKALMNDPKVLADPTATHTPELKLAWETAADNECAYREAHGLLHPCNY